MNCINHLTNNKRLGYLISSHQITLCYFQQVMGPVAIWVRDLAEVYCKMADSS